MGEKTKNRKTALMIMAAGLGSRYGGGVKQLIPVDDQGHIIIDYSIHDAIEAGFNRIVFIIRKDIEADFHEVIGQRIEQICAAHDVEVCYAFQELKDVPIEVPAGRVKPWGTGHAVLAAKAYADMPFAVINADDYYGKKAFTQLHDWLVEDHGDKALAMSGFVLKNTLSDNGGVTRGICKMEGSHMHIVDVVETKNIIKTPSGPKSEGMPIDPDSYVSMNMWGFPAAEGQVPPFMEALERHFHTFFEQALPKDPKAGEYLLPTLIGKLLREEAYTVRMIPTYDRWFGVTYAADHDAVVESFRELRQAGVYQEDLYADL